MMVWKMYLLSNMAIWGMSNFRVVSFFKMTRFWGATSMQLELEVVEVPGRGFPVLNNISMEFEKGDTWKLHKNQMGFFDHLDWWIFLC